MPVHSGLATSRGIPPPSPGAGHGAGIGPMPTPPLQEITVGSLAFPRDICSTEIVCSVAGDLFRSDPLLTSLIVRSPKGEIGLVTRDRFLSVMSKRYGWSLYADKPLWHLLPDKPSLLVDADMTIADASRLATSRDIAYRYDDLIVRCGGDYATLPVSRLMNRMTQMLDGTSARFISLVQHSSDVILVIDSDLKTLYVSPSVKQIMGYAQDEILGSSLLRFIHPGDLETAHARLLEIMQHQQHPARLEVRAQHSDGTWRWVEAVITNLLGDENVQGIVVNYRDVTERHTLEEELRRQAFQDPLTGLANRALFNDRLSHALAHGQRKASSIAVLFIDLDDFKTVNDTLGHHAGDRLLEVVAERICGCLRATDTAARLGGDEFAILLEGIGEPDEVPQIASRILDSISAPTDIQGNALSVTASCGIAVGDGSESASELLRRADIAMYRTKTSGKGTAESYEPQMGTNSRARLQLKSDLKTALDQRQFVLNYQPIFEITTKKITGCEALLRWNHPKRGLVSPSEFIPLAEDMGLISSIGQWVLAEACRQMGRWQEELDDRAPKSISVNLSPTQFDHPNLVSDLEAVLVETRQKASNLKLEITESTTMRDVETTVRRFDQLRSLGVGIALDDFGTGYSSLAYLRRFPIDELKIDKLFIDNIAKETGALSLLGAILTLARSLGLKTVAEGVESPEQFALLSGLGCDLGQGFLMWRPLDAEALTRILRSSMP